MPKNTINLMTAVNQLTNGRNAEQIAEDTGLPLDRCKELVVLSNQKTDDVDVQSLFIHTGPNYEALRHFLIQRAECVTKLESESGSEKSTGLLASWIGPQPLLDIQFDNDVEALKAEFSSIIQEDTLDEGV